jgi:hypothetical protein
MVPLPREIILGDRDAGDVGSLYKDSAVREGVELSANLFLPENTLQRAIFCLGSIWRQIHMWVDDDGEPHSIMHFGFSAEARKYSQTDNT